MQILVNRHRVRKRKYQETLLGDGMDLEAASSSSVHPFPLMGMEEDENLFLLQGNLFKEVDGDMDQGYGEGHCSSPEQLLRQLRDGLTTATTIAGGRSTNSISGGEKCLATGSSDMNDDDGGGGGFDAGNSNLISIDSSPLMLGNANLDLVLAAPPPAPTPAAAGGDDDVGAAYHGGIVLPSGGGFADEGVCFDVVQPSPVQAAGPPPPPLDALDANYAVGPAMEELSLAEGDLLLFSDQPELVQQHQDQEEEPSPDLHDLDSVALDPMRPPASESDPHQQQQPDVAIRQNFDRIDFVLDHSSVDSGLTPMLLGTEEEEEERKVVPDVDGLCQVCGVKPCGKHLYYGARACQGCRAFFRRAVADNRYADFSCKASQNCRFDVKKFCSFCRYSRCLRAGMNPKWMMTDSERREKNQRRKGGSGSSSTALVSPGADAASTALAHPYISHLGRAIFYKTPDLHFTRDEMQQVFTVIKIARNCYFETMTNLLSTNLNPARAIYDLNIHGKMPEPPFIKSLEELLRQAHKTYFIRLSEEIHSLDLEDLGVLAEHNFDAYFTTICAHYFTNPDFHNNLKSMCRYLMEERKDVLKFDNFGALLEGFQDFEKAGKQAQLEYDEVYGSLWSPDSTYKQRHKDLIRRLQDWSRDGPGQPCDVVSVTINILVQMLSTVGVTAGLKDRAKVEGLQEEFVQMLYRYLKFVHGSAGRASSKLTSGMMDNLLAKEAYAMHRAMTIKMM